MQCKKTHTGGCTNHRQISISLKRNVDSVSRCLEECTQDKRCEGFSIGKTNTPVDRTCILYREGCQKDSTNKKWDFYSKKDCITSTGNFKSSKFSKISFASKFFFNKPFHSCNFKISIFLYRM